MPACLLGALVGAAVQLQQPQLWPGPVYGVLLALAGVALLHGLVAQKRLAGFWLVGLYVSLLLFLQLIYPLLMVLAIVDSLFDFRGRQRHKPDDAANGEG